MPERPFQPDGNNPFESEYEIERKLLTVYIEEFCKELSDYIADEIINERAQGVWNRVCCSVAPSTLLAFTQHNLNERYATIDALGFAWRHLINKRRKEIEELDRLHPTAREREYSRTRHKMTDDALLQIHYLLKRYHSHLSTTKQNSQTQEQTDNRPTPVLTANDILEIFKSLTTARDSAESQAALGPPTLLERLTSPQTFRRYILPPIRDHVERMLKGAVLRAVEEAGKSRPPLSSGLAETRKNSSHHDAEVIDAILKALPAATDTHH